LLRSGERRCCLPARRSKTDEARSAQPCHPERNLSRALRETSGVEGPRYRRDRHGRCKASFPGLIFCHPSEVEGAQPSPARQNIGKGTASEACPERSRRVPKRSQARHRRRCGATATPLSRRGRFTIGRAAAPRCKWTRDELWARDDGLSATCARKTSGARCRVAAQVVNVRCWALPCVVNFQACERPFAER
jgi:hypothetical protein